LFEVGGDDRLLAMEGLRGVAVGLVFLQHYCVSFINLADLDGPTLAFASAFRRFGNYGVELFFVLSGFLIYGMLLRQRPALLAFMGRRAKRLYPAFLVALSIGILLDPLRPDPKIPSNVLDALAFLGANIAFLPGLFPIEPLFAVNWSLSYEWWFYALCTVLVAGLGLARLPRLFRIAGIVALALTLIACSAAGLPETPIRGLCLLAGMLLAEARGAGGRKIASLPAFLACALTFVLLATLSLPPWQNALILAITFYLLAAAAFDESSTAAALMRLKPFRWLGNISYSFYLIHGFAVLTLAHLVLDNDMTLSATTVFWPGLLPTFPICLALGAALFLLVEKPFSLQRRQPRNRTAAMTASTPDPAERV
jgi:peptidoglycan/LPS O-acetylase OafA/YrhL